MDQATGLRFRFWMFLLGCIGSRSLFTWLASRASGLSLRIMGAMALVPVIGWLWLVFVGRRDTGLEVLGGRIWWAGLRPVHLLLWAFFAYLAFLGVRWAWIVLAVDTAFGLGAFLAHHYAEGNLRIMLSRE
jgi:hypothetical protein